MRSYLSLGQSLLKSTGVSDPLMPGDSQIVLNDLSFRTQKFRVKVRVGFRSLFESVHSQSKVTVFLLIEMELASDCLCMHQRADNHPYAQSRHSPRQLKIAFLHLQMRACVHTLIMPVCQNRAQKPRMNAYCACTYVDNGRACDEIVCDAIRATRLCDSIRATRLCATESERRDCV